jgi:hypothetical protein
MAAFRFLRLRFGGRVRGEAGRPLFLRVAAGHRSGTPEPLPARHGAGPVVSSGVTRPAGPPTRPGRVAPIPSTLNLRSLAATAGNTAAVVVAAVGLWAFASPNPVVVAAAWVGFPAAVLWLVYTRRGK